MLSLDTIDNRTKMLSDNNELKNIFVEEKDIDRIYTDSLCIRYMRKKYHCTIIYCLLLLVLMQIILQIITKLDTDSIDNLISFFKQGYSNKTFNVTNNEIDSLL
jgi:hypothetical protein